MLSFKKPKSLRQIKPHDCALAVGIPVIKSEFLDDLDTQAPNYANFFVRTNHLQGKQAYGKWVEYAPTCQYIEKVCGEVENDGVTVDRQITLGKFSELFEKHAVVTLITHTVHEPITDNDILAPANINKMISEGSQWYFRGLREHPGWPGMAKFSQIPENEARRVLGKFFRELNGIAENYYTSRSVQPDYVRKVSENSTVPAYLYTRPLLESIFGNNLLGGPAFEFRDRVYRMSELIDAIPEDFDGILDLTQCNSAIFSTAIKNARPKCLIGVTRTPINPEIRFAIYRTIVKSLRRAPQQYYKVVTMIHNQMMESRNEKI